MSTMTDLIDDTAVLAWSPGCVLMALLIAYVFARFWRGDDPACEGRGRTTPNGSLRSCRKNTPGPEWGPNSA
jgi:hypothetical protein